MSNDLNAVQEIFSVSAAATRNADQAYHLDIPGSATQLKKSQFDDPERGGWQFGEAGNIDSLSVYASVGKSGRTHVAYVVRVEIGPEGSGTNVGKKVGCRMALCKAALDEGDEDNGEHKMSMISIRRIKQFFRSLGVDPLNEEGELDGTILAQYFTPKGEPSPADGEYLAFEVQQAPSDKDVKALKAAEETGDDHIIENYNVEISKFMPQGVA